MKRALSYIASIQPHWFFLACALALGALYNFFTPPFQANDEDNHFKRVYQITEGYFLPFKQNQRLGGYMPFEYRRFTYPYTQIATNLKQNLNEEKVLDSDSAWADNSEREFVDFPNTSYYCPVSYLPQALAVYVALKKEISFKAVYYSGRIFIYLIWTLCMFFIIRALPAYRWLFTMLALLPMQVYISNSFSADTVTNILALSFLGLVMRFAADDKEVNLKRLALLLVIGILLALSKIVYVGLVFSLLIIPASKYKSRFHARSYALLLFACCFAAAYFWSETVLRCYTPYSEYNPSARDISCVSSCANYDLQKELILSDNTYFLNVIYRSIFNHPHTYFRSYVANLGQTDMVLPGGMYTLAYLAVFFLVLFEKNIFSLRLWQKSILFFSAFVSFVLLLLSQHLTWDCVGDGVVDLIQGRYLIPLFPSMFLLFTHSKMKFDPGCVIVVALSAVILNYAALRIINNRFHKDSSIASWEISCDAEKITKDKKFITSNPKVLLGDGLLKYDSVSFSGKSSARLKKPMPFAFTYRFRGLQYGDHIELSLWQKGNSVQIVFSGEGKYLKDYYLPFRTVVKKRPDGWSKTDHVFTITIPDDKAKNANYTLFVWNTDSTKYNYADDFKFRLRRFLPYSPTEPDYW